MSIGNMRNRLQIQRATKTADGGGSFTLVWSTITTVYGSIMPRSSDESVFADKLRDKKLNKIIVRYRSNLTTENRLVQDYRRDGNSIQRIFVIKGVLNIDNEFKYLELDCEEGVAT